MEPLRFSIQLSTKDRRDDLLLTLQKISTLIDRRDTECIVYDDGSADGTSETVRQRFPQVKLLRNETSRGYIFCRNAMLDKTGADFVVSLDDDAHFLTETPLEIIERHFSENPECGVIACRIFWGADAPADTRTAAENQRVKGFVGCAHVWRTDAWNDIPGYPEWFEFYGEEMFAAYELFLAGWEVHYLPQVLVHHRVDMQARRNMAGFATRYRRNLRNDWHLYFLFYPWAKIPRRMAYSLWMQARKIFRGKRHIAGPVLRALGDLLTSGAEYRRHRNALSKKQWDDFKKLPDTKIYWTPEK